jgi:hypothetical protein
MRAHAAKFTAPCLAESWLTRWSRPKTRAASARAPPRSARDSRGHRRRPNTPCQRCRHSSPRCCCRRACWQTTSTPQTCATCWRRGWRRCVATKGGCATSAATERTGRAGGASLHGLRRGRRRLWCRAPPPRAVAPLQRKACKSASSQAPPRAPQRRRGEAEYGFLPPARVNRAFLRHWTRPASNGCDSGDVAIRREGRFAQKWATTGSVCDRDVRYVGKIGEFAVGPRARYLVVITRKGVIDGR